MHVANRNFICEHPTMNIEVETVKAGARPSECGSFHPSTCENGDICVYYMWSSLGDLTKTTTATDNYDLSK